MKRLLIFSLLFSFLLAGFASATDYYIDFNGGSDSNNGLSKGTPWKLCPGMNGFSGSYSHQPGDRFIFKGGVTWTAVPGQNILDIGYSGGSANPDQYTVDKTWYSGSSWDYPVFNGNALGNFGIYVFNKSNLIFDGLKLVNIGETVGGSGQGFVIIGANASNIEIKNFYFDTNGVNHLAYSPDTASHFYFHDNHIKNGGRIIIGQSNNKLDDIRLYNNLFEGPGTYNPHNYHCDGFMIGADNGGLLTNLYVYNNKFYGDWHVGATAAIYLNGVGNGAAAQPSIDGAWIYNNVIAPENNDCTTMTFSPGAITVYSGLFDHIYIYSNTISGDNCPQNAITGIYLVTVKTSAIVNNILSGVDNAIILDSSFIGPITLDYNQFNTVGGNHLLYDGLHNNRYNDCVSLKNAGYGYAPNYCSNSDPKFLAIPNGGITGSGNFHLQQSSPAIDHGISLSSYFTTDLDGIFRPQGSAWDIGAYEYVQATQTCSQQGGSCCPSGQFCSTGSFTSSTDCSFCCVGGTCRTPSCGDGFCDPGETCPIENCCNGQVYSPGTQVCCSSSLYTGNCCSDSNCTSPKTCNNHVCTKLCDNLMLLMHFDNQAQYGESPTKAYDFSGNGNNASCSGASCPTYTTSGKFSGAFQFDGTNDLASVPVVSGSTLDIDPNPVTMVAWIKPNTVSVQQAIVARGRADGVSLGWDGFGFWINSSGRINVGSFGGGNFDGNTALSANTWYHVAVVINGASSALYLNGADDTPASHTVDVLASDKPLKIGAARNSTDTADMRFFSGIIDELAIWNRALSSQEIQSLYSSSQPISCGASCIHKSDSNPCDGCVDMTELSAFINRWNINNLDVTMKELIEAIGLWNEGC